MSQLKTRKVFSSIFKKAQYCSTIKEIFEKSWRWFGHTKRTSREKASAMAMTITVESNNKEKLKKRCI